MMFAIIAAAVVIVLAVVSLLFLSKSKGDMSGPWGFPFVGSLLFFLGDHIHAVLLRWSYLYGSLYQVRLGSSLVVVANDLQSIREIQLKKEFAGRPDWLTIRGVSGYGNDIVFSDQSAAYFAHRRVVSRCLLNNDTLEKAIIQEGERLCQTLENEAQRGKPVDCQAHVYFAVASITFGLLFDKDIEPNDQNYLDFKASVDELGEAISSGGIFNFLPWLRHVPGPSRRMWNDISFWTRRLQDSLYDRYFDAVKTFDCHRERRETIADCLLAGVAKEHPDQSLHEQEAMCTRLSKVTESSQPNSSLFNGLNIQGTCMDLFGAGMGTVTSTILWIIAMAATHPHLQQQVREEIMSTVPVDETPSVTLRDENRLPFLEAFVKETTRLYPAAPMALPHKATEDTLLRGHHIAKGTTAFLNIWGAHRNPSVFEDPDTFHPNRFLGSKAKDIEKHLMPFSAGHRICIGRNLAKMELFLLTVMLFRKFKIETVPGKEPDLNPIVGKIGLDPNPFVVKLEHFN